MEYVVTNNEVCEKVPDTFLFIILILINAQFSVFPEMIQIISTMYVQGSNSHFEEVIK